MVHFFTQRGRTRILPGCGPWGRLPMKSPRAAQREIVVRGPGQPNRLRVEDDTPSIKLGTMREMTVSLRNDEVRTLAFGGIGADPDGATCRLNQVLHINVPEGEFVSAYGEVYPP